MKRFLLIIFCMPLHAMERPTKRPAIKDGLFPESLSHAPDKSRWSPCGNFCLQQARCCDPDHFHVAIYNLKTLSLLYVKKLYNPYLYKFSPRDTYFALATDQDATQLEISHTATGQVAYNFKVAPSPAPDDFGFSSDERILRFLVYVNKKDKTLEHTQLLDLATMKALGCVPHRKTDFIRTSVDGYNLLETSFPSYSGFYHYSYPYDPAQLKKDIPCMIERCRLRRENQTIKKLEQFAEENFD